jgi:hypothetical protein
LLLVGDTVILDLEISQINFTYDDFPSPRTLVTLVIESINKIPSHALPDQKPYIELDLVLQ